MIETKEFRRDGEKIDLKLWTEITYSPILLL